ncbi:MAG TPA: biotin/lipoyl-binding protein [Marmoricola sp.]|nr:biotin/lipoyl-binding protein [Marmoricola sp.]
MLLLPLNDYAVLEGLHEYGGRDGYQLVADVTVARAGSDRVTLVTDGLAQTFAVTIADDRVHVDGPDGSMSFGVVPRFVDPADQVAAGSLLAPMPGSVIEVAKQAGEPTRAGEVIVVLEAMKMQHAIKAPTDGTVSALPVSVGTQVAAGEVLAVIDEGEPA